MSPLSLFLLSQIFECQTFWGLRAIRVGAGWIKPFRWRNPSPVDRCCRLGETDQHPFSFEDFLHLVVEVLKLPFIVGQGSQVVCILKAGDPNFVAHLGRVHPSVIEAIADANSRVWTPCEDISLKCVHIYAEE